MEINFWLEEDPGIEELMDELLNDYISILEKEININDVTIKLDGSLLSGKKKGNCCKGNESKIKLRNRSLSATQKTISTGVSANENKDK